MHESRWLYAYYAYCAHGAKVFPYSTVATTCFLASKPLKLPVNIVLTTISGITIFLSLPVDSAYPQTRKTLSLSRILVTLFNCTNIFQILSDTRIDESIYTVYSEQNPRNKDETANVSERIAPIGKNAWNGRSPRRSVHSSAVIAAELRPIDKVKNPWWIYDVGRGGWSAAIARPCVVKRRWRGSTCARARIWNRTPGDTTYGAGSRDNDSLEIRPIYGRKSLRLDSSFVCKLRWPLMVHDGGLAVTRGTFFHDDNWKGGKSPWRRSLFPKTGCSFTLLRLWQILRVYGWKRRIQGRAGLNTIFRKFDGFVESRGHLVEGVEKKGFEVTLPR